jgi:hypothetical protein
MPPGRGRNSADGRELGAGAVRVMKMKMGVQQVPCCAGAAADSNFEFQSYLLAGARVRAESFQKACSIVPTTRAGKKKSSLS